jgi:hypothetical protein
MMLYLCIRWFHTLPTEPSKIYAELDGERWEVRKVEVFADKRMQIASVGRQQEDTMLSTAPYPELAEINDDPQFQATSITQQEFESIWNLANRTKL